MISMGTFNREQWGRPKWRHLTRGLPRLNLFDTPHKDLTHVIRRTNEYIYSPNPNIEYEDHSSNQWTYNREWENWKVYNITSYGRGHRMTWHNGQGSFNGNNIPAFLFQD